MNVTHPVYTLVPPPEYQILPPNHWLYQIANFCLLLSFFMFDVLYLRVLLSAGALVFMMWCIFVLQVALDGALWNFIFFVINIGHIIKMVYDKRPLVFDADKEFIWEHIFYENFRMDRHTFSNLTASCEIITIEKDQYYGRIGDLVTRLSVIIDGNIEVQIPNNNNEQKSLIAQLRPLDFIDSPEWVQRVSHFSVNLKCTTQVKVLSWPSLTIRRLKNNTPQLWGSLTGILAKDITRKLMEIQRRFMESDINRTKLKNIEALYRIEPSRTLFGGATGAHPNKLHSKKERQKNFSMVDMSAESDNDTNSDKDKSDKDKSDKDTDNNKQ